jgi:hypothetical protein
MILRSTIAAISLAGALAALAACESHPLDATIVVPTTLTNGLLAHYTFDEGAGTMVFDHSGNRHDGTLVGGTWIGDGKFGGALHFSGSDHVTVDSFPIAHSSFSVSAWVRSKNAPIDGFETLLSTEVVFEAGWELNLDKLDSGLAVQSAYWDPTIGGYIHIDCSCLPTSQWTHVVSVVDGDAHVLSVYVDGNLVGVTPAGHAILPGETALLIGTWSGGARFLVGDIDDVAIYSRALIPEEVSDLEAHPPPDPL